MRQALGPGALGRPRGIGWRGRWEGGLGWGIHVNPWLICVNVWQNPLNCCEVISLQLIKMKKKKKSFSKSSLVFSQSFESSLDSCLSSMVSLCQDTKELSRCLTWRSLSDLVHHPGAFIDTVFNPHSSEREVLLSSF